MTRWMMTTRWKLREKRTKALEGQFIVISSETNGFQGEKTQNGWSRGTKDEVGKYIPWLRNDLMIQFEMACDGGTGE